MNMGGNLGGTLSPTLTPWFAQQFGWESALYVAAASAVLGALLWLGVHPEHAINLGKESLAQPQERVAVSVGH
jgi:ACS family glucarate transporter-like MFS transporter